MKKDTYYADVAASLQNVIEDILIKMSAYLYKETGLKKLCVSGGVALNCAANSRILKESPFEEIYIQPACGDSGAAMGGALYFYHCCLNERRRSVLNHAYLGKEYSSCQIEEFLGKNSIPYKTATDEEKMLDSVVDALIAQKVIGWFQGRFEWGPRALGNRSILADPRNADMKDLVNEKIKFREAFRPFAPAVLSDKADEYFDFGKSKGHYPHKFMLYTVAATKAELIPAVTHIDGTSRVQVVEKDTNRIFYKLIEKFYQKTGVPVLLNTSFNLRGEPIVDSPGAAYKTFLKSGMDMLVLGKYILEK